MSKINLQEPQRNRNANANFVNLIGQVLYRGDCYRGDFERFNKMCKPMAYSNQTNNEFGF